jgi:hypothetical protein
MFICQLCWIYTKPREKAFRIVTQIREKIYPPRPNAHTFIPRDEPGKKVIKDDPGGRGFEIAKEVLACQACAKVPPAPKIVHLTANA